MDTHINQLSAVSAGEAARDRVLLSFASLLALGLAIGAAFALSRSVTRRLSATARVLERFANGGLTVRGRGHGNDEVAEIGKALNIALGSVSNTVTAISGGITRLDQAAARLSGVSHQLAEGADLTAAQSASGSSTAGEISHTVDALANGTQELQSAAQEIAERVSTAARQASEGVHQAQATTEMVSRLAKSSTDVSGCSR